MAARVKLNFPLNSLVLFRSCIPINCVTVTNSSQSMYSNRWSGRTTFTYSTSSSINSICHYYPVLRPRLRQYSRLGSKIQSSEVRKGKKIKAKSVLLIDENGVNLGNMDTPMAMKMALAKGLELIQVTKDEEPVCKLISKKQLWEESKNAKERNKKDPKAVTKEVQVMVGISEHDLQTKIKAIRSFLEREHSIRLWVHRKRRQRFSVGQSEQEQLMEEIIERVKDLGSRSNQTYTPKGLNCMIKSTPQK